MKNSGDFARIREEVDYLCAKRGEQRFMQPCIVTVHGYRAPGTNCAPGESVEGAHIEFSGRSQPLGLSPSGLLILDCLARYQPSPLTARRMEDIFCSDPFYRYLGRNGARGVKEQHLPTRTTIKVYMKRLGRQIEGALRELGISRFLDDIVIAEPTDSNIVAYRASIPLKVRHNNTTQWI